MNTWILGKFLHSKRRCSRQRASDDLLRVVLEETVCQLGSRKLLYPLAEILLNTLFDGLKCNTVKTETLETNINV